MHEVLVIGKAGGADGLRHRWQGPTPIRGLTHLDEHLSAKFFVCFLQI